MMKVRIAFVRPWGSDGASAEAGAINIYQTLGGCLTGRLWVADNTYNSWSNLISGTFGSSQLSLGVAGVTLG